MEAQVLPGWRKLSAWMLIYGMVLWTTHAGKPLGETEAELLWRISILFFGGNGLEWMTKLIVAWRSK